jgi:hypothetical protein
MGNLLGSIAGGFNLGNLVEGFCDAIGVPEGLGDLASGAANYLSGNIPGMIEDGFDLAENLMTDPNAQKGEARGSWRGRADGGNGDPFTARATPVASVEPAPPSPAGGGRISDGRGKELPMDPYQSLEDIKAGKKPEWMDQKEWNKMELQMRMQEYNEMITLLTQMMKMHHDTMMQIIRNIG